MSAKQRDAKAVRRLERNGDEQTDDLKQQTKLLTNNIKNKTVC